MYKLVIGSLAFGCLLGGTSAAARETDSIPSLDACTVLSQADIGRVLSQKVAAGQRFDSGKILAEDGLETAYSSTCLWRISTDTAASDDQPLHATSYIMLHVMRWRDGPRKARTFLQSFRDAAAAGALDQAPVPLKIADEALWWGDGVALRKGNQTFGISVHMPGRRDAERDWEITLARRIAARS